jgi:hypothetical protein
MTPMKPKIVYTVFKNSGRTAKKTQPFTITNINWLTLFKEIIHGESLETHKYRLKDLLIVEPAGKYTYH